jgi:hypothetical protein
MSACAGRRHQTLRKTTYHPNAPAVAKRHTQLIQQLAYSSPSPVLMVHSPAIHLTPDTTAALSLTCAARRWPATTPPLPVVQPPCMHHTPHGPHHSLVQHAAGHVLLAEAARLLQVHHHEVLLHVATQDLPKPTQQRLICALRAAAAALALLVQQLLLAPAPPTTLHLNTTKRTQHAPLALTCAARRWPRASCRSCTAPASAPP